MSYQWRRLQFFEKVVAQGRNGRPLRFFDAANSALTCTASGHGYLFGGDNKGLIHRFLRTTNSIDQFQAFDTHCLHLLCVPEVNMLLAVGYDHDAMTPLNNPVLKFFKFAPPAQTSNNTLLASQQALQQQQLALQGGNNNNNNNANNNTGQQPMATDFTCVRTIPLSSYLTNTTINRETGSEHSKTVTITCITATDDANYIALGCSDGSLVTIELSKTRYISNVWFRDLPNQPQQQDKSQWPQGPITTIHYRPSSTQSYLSLYITTMSGLYMVHQSRSSLSAELLSPDGCHYYGSSLCFNSVANSVSSLGELVLVCPELTVFYSQEGDRLSCYSFPDHKKFIAFYNHFLIIVSDEGTPTPQEDSGFTSSLGKNLNQGSSSINQATNPSSPQYNSPLSRLAQTVNPAGRNAIVIYDIHSKITVFSLKCDVIVGLQVIQQNQISFITQRGEVMILTELPLRNKMSVLLRRDLFSVALSLASSQCADRRLIIDITYKYGDYLYNKGDYDAATQNYVETIGYVEPSIIISKFLHSQRITCLTMYLEALHLKHMITCDHTTLLLTCYTKLRDLKKITSFLLQQHQLSKISAATPIETLKALEYCRVFCNSLPIDFGHVDEMSKVTHIGEYLLRILHQAVNNGVVDDIDASNQQVFDRLSALTTLYTTQHYHSLDLYNTIRVYIECGYYYHALYAAFLLGAHEFAMSLLLQLGFYQTAIQYISSLPIHLAAWLLHQFGLQLLRELPDEVTLLCIKLICGWKRQPMVHNMILTIQQDTTTTSTAECSATVDSMYKFDDQTLDEHFAFFQRKQDITHDLMLQQEQQQLSGTSANTTNEDQQQQGLMGNTTGALINTTNNKEGGKDNKSSLLEHHIYLRFIINDDGCVSILKSIGFEKRDLTSLCSNDDSQLIHLTNAAIAAARQQRKPNPQPAPQQAKPANNNNFSGELSLDDFADDKPIPSPQQQGQNTTMINYNTNLIETVYVSPADFIPLFSDAPQYLQSYLEAICAHATNIHQQQSQKNLLDQQRRRNNADNAQNTQPEMHLLKDDASVLRLNRHTVETTTMNATNTRYDYLRQLNQYQLGPATTASSSSALTTSQFNTSQALSFTATLDLDTDITPLMQFPTNTTANVNVGTIGRDVNNTATVIATQIACDNSIWTSLIEYYAALIKTFQRNNGTNPVLKNALTQASATTTTTITTPKDSTGQTNTDTKQKENTSLLTFATYKTTSEVENQVINIIKTNMDLIDYSSVLVILETHDLEASLSFLYARTRQYHSLLNLQTNHRDWVKSKQVCQAYGAQEPSLWLFLLVKIVECYPSPEELESVGYVSSNANTNNPSQSGNNGGVLVHQGKDKKSYTELIELLTLCVREVKRLALLSPLQIMSVLSTSPYIPIDPIQSFLLDTISELQHASVDFTRDAQAFANDSLQLQQQINQLQYEPLIYKSIDCQRCKQQLTMPTIHFYCGHSFHQHCVIENDTSQHQQRQYQQQISSLYDVISSTQIQGINAGNNDSVFNSQNPYSTLLHDPSLSSNHTHQQLLLQMFNQPLEYECPLCQAEHQRLQFMVTSLFGTNDPNSANNATDALDFITSGYDGNNNSTNPNDPKATKAKKQANSVYQAQVHDKFIKRLDDHVGDFGIIAEQLSRGMFVPHNHE